MEIITNADGEDSNLCVLKSVRINPVVRVERSVEGETMMEEEQSAIVVEMAEDDEIGRAHV